MRLKKIIIPFLIVIASLAGIDSVAQNKLKPDEYRAILWSMEDGLPNGGFNVMLKDVKGFLWIGNIYGGLCRFDGAVFKKYLPDQHNRGAINSDRISALIEDSLNNIWIGTVKGLSRYDMKADTFTNFSTDLDSNKSIIPFWSTGSHLYCLESGVRIVVYSIHSFEKKSLTLTESDITQRNVPGIVSAILDTVSNSLWMLGGDPKRSGLLKISLNDSERQSFTWPCYRNIPNHDHGSEAMSYDPKRNSIWINSSDGLMEFSLDDKQFHHIDALNEFVKLKDYDRVVGIDIDKDGRIWLSTQPKGVLIYDPNTEQVRQLFSDPELQQKIAEYNLYIYCDRDGITWASYFMIKGIYELLPYDPPVTRYVANTKIKDSLSSSTIYTIVPGTHDQIWIGTKDGVNIFDTNKGKFKVMRQQDLPGMSGNVIVPVYVDTIHQKAWLSAVSPHKYQTTMYEMDIKTMKCKPIIFRDGSKQLNTFGIVPFVTQPYKNGLLVCDESRGIYEIKENSLFADLLIPFTSPVGGMAVEEDHFIFVMGGGLDPNFSFENKNGTWIRSHHFLDSLDWVYMLYNKKDRTYWVSFKGELVHYDKEFRKIKSYSQDEGYNGTVYNMQIDNAGNLWFINILNQVGRLNVATDIITTLSEADGYQKQKFDWFDPGAKDGRGNIYFGASNPGTENGGLDVIHPERYSSANTSSAYLRSLFINQKPFPLSTGVNSLQELFLRYDQNTISLETGIIDHYAKGKGHIRYKLEKGSKSEDWQYSPAYYTIRYDGLRPGKYKLTLQASNAGNEFNSPEKILMIHISPPFWETWWFRILAAVIGIAIIYAIIHWRSRSLKKRNVQLEEKVMVRTKELKHSLEDLRDTQAQLIQSEKMASLGELTAGIAHEIQNPLNFVNNFSEVSNELIDEMQEEIDKGNTPEVKLIVSDIKQNLEKINHHGKRADAIVKGMLQHSRASAGVKELIDINALADEYLRLSYHGFRAKEKTFNATMQTDFDQNIQKINIIPQDIGKVLLNLINNSFYAVNEKKKLQPEDYEPTVSVTTKKLTDKIEVKIRDNGIGIPQKILDKIFQPFFTTKPTGQGTGLGLSLAYDIVKAHGGDLKVETKEGKDVEFIMQLPA